MHSLHHSYKTLRNLGSDEGKKHVDASNTTKFEANGGDDVEGPEVIQFGVHCAVYCLAHIAAHWHDATVQVVPLGIYDQIHAINVKRL